MNFDVTIVLPIKGKADKKRFNRILRPSLDKIRGVKLCIVTNENINPRERDYLPCRVIKDENFDIPSPMCGWRRQQVIKLQSHRYVDTKWMLAMDADCFFMFEGLIDLLMPNDKPFVNTKHGKHQNKWWLKSSAFLGKHIPEVRCGVTPMFLKTKICQQLDSSKDIGDMIKRGATEYSLYWTYLDGNYKDYTLEPLVLPGDAYWNKGGKGPTEFAKKVFARKGRMGLIQSTAENKHKGILRELINIYDQS